MSETDNLFAAFDFKQFQAQCMDSLQELLKQQHYSNPSSKQQSAVIQNLSEQIQFFYTFLSILSELLTGINSELDDKEQKKRLVGEMMTRLKIEVDNSLLGPMGLWQKLQNGFTANGFMQNVDPMQYMQEYFNLPTLGFSREQQENLKEGARLWKVYQKNLNNYEAVLLRINSDVIELLKIKLIERIDKDESINSLREIYDMWISASEERYFEFVITEEYSILYGDLINALMQIKQFINKNTNDILQSMNLPTQTAMQSVLLREKELKNKLSSLQDEIVNIKKMLHEPNMSQNMSQTDSGLSKTIRKTTKKTSRKKTSKKKVSKKKVAKKKSTTKKSKKKPS